MVIMLKDIFVVNEGSFGKSSGSLTHVSSSGSVVGSAFKAINGIPLGETFQSMREINLRYYLSVSGADRVYVLDKYSLEKKGEIRVLFARDVISSSNNRVYVSSGYKSGSYLHEVDLSTYKLTSDSLNLNTPEIKSIKPSRFLRSGSRIFMTGVKDNNYHLGYIENVELSDKKVQYIPLQNQNPRDMVLDQDFKLWVLCVGKIENFVGTGAGSIFKIDQDTKEVENKLHFPLEKKRFRKCQTAL